VRFPDRKETEVRRMLDGPGAPLPPDLAARAVDSGARLLRRRHAVRAVLWCVTICAVLAFAAWAAVVHPWVAPPSDVTPPPGQW
jgi:ferric-dicitrate binding protein FerR (iron transport regulator)